MNASTHEKSPGVVELSLVIPTLNERDNIVPLLTSLQEALRTVSHEVIVVDDNSSDRTWEVVDGFAKSHPNVVLVRNERPNGLSAAVIEGFRRSRGSVLGVMDADLSHDEKILVPLLTAIRNGAPMAVGSRRAPGGGADYWPWFRRFYSACATVLAKVLFHIPFRDPMSGYFLLRRDVFESVEDKLNPKGYKILLEIVVRGQVDRVDEIGFIFKDRKQGYSKLTKKVAAQYFAMIWDLRPYYPCAHWLRKTYHTGRYRKVRKLLKEGRTLDIGCGQPCETMPEQAFLRFLGRPGSVGLDIKAIKGPYEFHRGSITQIPFPDASFDNVVAMEVLEHITEVELALSEISRVLKPNGVFVMSTPDCGPVWDKIWDQWTHLIGQMWHEAHVVSMNVTDWKKLLEQGFRVTRFQRHWMFDLVFGCVKK